MDGDHVAGGAKGLPSETVHAYAAGNASWREIRDQTGCEDFNVMLTRLAEEGLRLPRAPRERQSKAKMWMREILAARGLAA